MNTKSNAFLAMIIMITPCMAALVANTGKGDGIDVGIPASLATITPSAAHVKINIVGNTQLDAFFAGNASNGTPGNPYIIQYFEINAAGTGSAIYLEDTSKHVIIQHCTLQGSGSTTGSAGIRLTNCTNVAVRSNAITGNARNGIQVEAGSRNITITGNAITSNTYTGVNVIESRDCIVSGNAISGVSNLSSDGIYLGTVSNVNVTWNNISSQINDGIWLYLARNCQVVGNRISDCYYAGITVSESSHTVIEDNVVTRCSTFGFEIFNDSCDNNITHNLVTFCLYAGIRFYNGNDNITGNSIWNNAFASNRDGESLTRWMNPPENDWDVGGIGNFWGDYEERYPDATASGNIWNIPYAINETLYALDYDNFPLVSIDLMGGPENDDPGDPNDDPGVEVATWIILVAFLVTVVLAVLRAYKAGVLLPWGSR